MSHLHIPLSRSQRLLQPRDIQRDAISRLGTLEAPAFAQGASVHHVKTEGVDQPGDDLLSLGEGADGSTRGRRRLEGLRPRPALRRRPPPVRPADHRVPRVSDKLAMMLAETVMARELSYFASTEKDKGHRCDSEAGMAKLLVARVAWSNADGSLQIHGCNAYALESEISRVLCDARILNIFEGAAEIQAQVVGRGLLGRVLLE